MGIDGIGKPPSPSGLAGPPIGLDGAEGTLGATKALAGQDVQGISGQPQASSMSPLDRLSRGEITREQYLDDRVERAISPYLNRLSPDKLEFIRTTLREQIEIDPTLAELARRAMAGAQTK